jgi:NADH-quinone oxidoreductase subunit N
LTAGDLATISPLIVAILTAIAIIVVDMIKPGSTYLAAGTAFIGLALTSVVTLVVGAAATAGTIDATAFGGGYTVDALTTFLDILFISVIALTIMFAPDYLTPRGLPIAEFASVLVFAMTGAMLISASTDLLLLFLGLELMVLPGYLLAAYHKTDAYSTEGAIKYFLLGSFSSAIFLFGLAYVWGMTGTTLITGPHGILHQLQEIVAGNAPLSPGLAMGLAFLTTGVAFKIAAVPFHYWTPDAYQGSPTPITGYLSVGPKIGAFALILRLFVEALGPLADWWLPVVIVLAALTMTLGNLVALTQDNVKRMLAYSSIAHTGYMLVGLAAYGAGQIDGLEGLLFYGAAYAFMNLGAFAVIAALQKRPGVTSSLETFSGLGRREPRLGVLMTIFLLSLTGIPPTAGFFAKAFVILAAVEAGGPLTILAVIAVINAAVAAFYYLRCVVYMYMRDPTSDAPPLRHGALVWSGLAVATALTLLIGLFPTSLVDIVQNAATAIATIPPR